MQSLIAGVRKMFGYDATEDRGRRRAPITTKQSEDREANDRKRRILSANSYDLARNYSVAAWAIRKHLDYVTSFTFQAKTADRGYNDELELIVNELMTRHRFDVARRHPKRRFLRITEACALRDGDNLWLKMAPPTGSYLRGKVQGIETDRLITPDVADIPANSDKSEWTNGIRLDPRTGESSAYAIHDRTDSPSRYKLNRIVMAKNVFHHGYFDRFDQARGISPIASGLNWFRDTYEGFEYANAKLKTDQLFGLAIMRDADKSTFAFNGVQATADGDGDGVEESDYEVDLTGPGPFSLDMNQGDKAEILSSRNPSTEVANYLKLMIEVSLKSLDIPFSFFSENFTNFYGSKGSMNQYLKSCRNRWCDLQDLQNDWCRWRLGLAIADGEIEIPSGMTFNDIRWEWVPDGVPWWDGVKEARGAAMAIAMGLSSPQRECKLSSTDFETNIRETSEAMAIANEYGVPLKFAESTAFNPEITVGAAE